MIEEKSIRLLPRWAVGGLCVVMAGFWAGCEESADSAVSQQTQESIDKAGRLIRSSSQEIAMTPGEIEQAGKAGTGQYPSLAGQIVNRLEGQADMSGYEKLLKELDELKAELQGGNNKVLPRIYELMIRASRELLLQQEKIDSPAQQERIRRLEAALATLKQALAQAQKTPKHSAPAGPELLVGTLGMIEARDDLGRLNDQELVIRTQEVFLSRLLAAFHFEQQVGAGLQGQQPHETITQLKRRLEATGGRYEQLDQAKEKLEQLTAREEQLQQQYQQNSEQARLLNQEYLALLEKADKAEGDKRYQLQQQAYEVRTGRGTGDDRKEGSIYYEAQTEITLNERAVLETNLQYARMRQEQLIKEVTNTERTISQLEDPAKLADLQKGWEQSNQSRQKIIADLKGRLDELAKAQTVYVERRLDAVSAYDESRAAFLRGARAAQNANTRDYADKWARWITEELAQLWQQDARHYKNSVAALSGLEDIEEIKPLVEQLSRGYKDQAAQAQESAAQAPAEQN